MVCNNRILQCLAPESAPGGINACLHLIGMQRIIRASGKVRVLALPGELRLFARSNKNQVSNKRAECATEGNAPVRPFVGFCSVVVGKPNNI